MDSHSKTTLVWMLCVLCAIICAAVSVNRYSVMKRRAAESARRRDALKSEIDELLRQKEAAPAKPGASPSRDKSTQLEQLKK